MSGDGVGRAVFIDLAYPWPKQHGEGQRDPAARAVHDARAGEVHRAVTQVPAVADLRQPAAAPEPVAIDGVDDGAKEKLGYYKRLEVDPLRDGANDDVAGGLHEDDLEEEEGERADVVRMARLEEEAVEAEQTPVAAAHFEQMAKHHRAAQVSGRGVDRGPAKLEGEADRKVTDPGDDESGEAEHHHGHAVLRARHSGGKRGETRR